MKARTTFLPPLHPVLAGAGITFCLIAAAHVPLGLIPCAVGLAAVLTWWGITSNMAVHE